MATPRLPNILAVHAGTNASAGYKWCKNVSGDTITDGDLVVLDIVVAKHALGLLLPVTTLAGADSDRVLGAVAVGQGTIADDGNVLIQIAGLHTGVLCDGTIQLDPNDLVCSYSNVKEACTEAVVDNAVGRYMDAVYAVASPALKAVFLTNPLGIQADL